MKIARPHQEYAIAKLRESISSGKRRPVLCLPTGAGKTFVATLIVEGALKKGNRVAFVVPAKSLINQTVEAFNAHGIYEIGVQQADHPMRNPMMPVQVCSEQTLSRRGVVHLADIVIVDECHRRSTFMDEWMSSEDWKGVLFIGLSATPWAKGMADYYDDLIIAETTQGLIDKGLLAPFRVFAAGHPDLSKVTMSGDDYNLKKLSEAMSEGKLISGIVDNWLANGENRPTFCFCVDVAHANKVREKFLNYGIGCDIITAHTETHDREEVKRKFHTGETKVVVNVGTLTTGVDWDVRCMILARATKSEILYTQMVGRVLRTAEGKVDALIFDHSDTTQRLGFVTDIHHTKLLGGQSSKSGKSEKETPLPKECKKCTYLKPAKVVTCPNCGHKPERFSDVEEVEGELKEVNGKKRVFTMDEKQAWYSGFIWMAKQKGHNPNSAYYLFRERFDAFPSNKLRKIPAPPTEEMENWMKYRNIRRAKRNELQRHNKA